MATWKIGDVVKLKSGGPKMTVRDPGSEAVDTDWFEGVQPRSGRFHPDQLIATLSEEQEKQGRSRKIQGAFA